MTVRPDLVEGPYSAVSPPTVVGAPLNVPTTTARATACAPPWLGEPVPQLAPGKPGKDGELALRLAYDPARGRTVAAAVSHRPPLQIGRLLYPDPELPDMAYCYPALLCGGLVQGDRMRMEVGAGERARAHVTTLAATKVYGMERSGAEQRVRLDAGPDAVLEWWPDPLVPFRGARLWQEAELLAHPTATLLYGDLVLPGRVAGGERHDYAYYRSRVTARRPDGSLLFADTQALAPPPSGARPLVETLPEGLHTIGSIFALVEASVLPHLLDDLRGWCAAADASAVLAGCSTLPHQCGVVTRFLAADAAAGRAALDQLLVILRQRLLGADGPPRRKP